MFPQKTLKDFLIIINWHREKETDLFSGNKNLDRDLEDVVTLQIQDIFFSNS